MLVVYYAKYGEEYNAFNLQVIQGQAKLTELAKRYYCRLNSFDRQYPLQFEANNRCPKKQNNNPIDMGDCQELIISSIIEVDETYLEKKPKKNQSKWVNSSKNLLQK